LGLQQIYLPAEGVLEMEILQSAPILLTQACHFLPLTLDLAAQLLANVATFSSQHHGKLQQIVVRD